MRLLVQLLVQLLVRLLPAGAHGTGFAAENCANQRSTSAAASAGRSNGKRWEPAIHDTRPCVRRSVWRDSAGDLRATMIADDNFSIFLSTEIVEYRLPG